MMKRFSLNVVAAALDGALSMARRVTLAALALSLASLATLAVSVPASAQSSPSPYISATRYDAIGRVVGTIAPDPDGLGSLKYAATRTTYDARGNATKVETGELLSWQSEAIAAANWTGFTIHTIAHSEYDLMSRKTIDRVQGSNGVVISLTQYSYDNRGRLECTAQRMNPAAYNSLPSSACTLGPQGADGPDRITKTVYDAAGQVLQIWRAYGTSDQISEVKYVYTPNGLVQHLIDANGNRTQYHYDGHDRRTRWWFPSKTRPTNFDPSAPGLATAGEPDYTDNEAYTYDANGNMLTLKKRDTSVITYEYDALNRMTRKTVPNRAGLASIHERDVFYEYDLRGLQTKALFDTLGSTGRGMRYTYDGFGRLTSEAQNPGGVTRNVSSQYDANGNRTRVTHADGTYFQYDYDGLNRLKTIGRDSTVIGATSYNSRGFPSEMAWTFLTSSNNKSTYGYDDAGRLDALSINLHGSSNDVTWSYTRNPASQIKSETQSNDAYSWDGHVNLNRSYTTNGLNQYTNAGGAAFCYDANGNLTADGNSVYLYDVENRLVEKRVQTNTNCSSLSYSGTRQATLYYDPTGRLYHLTDAAGSATAFVYDGNAMIMEYASASTILQRYVHGSNVGADDPLIWYETNSISASKRHFLHADPRGSIVAVTDYSGDLETLNSYDEYGIPSGSNEGRFQYTGQMWIPELGMYYYKARIYSPTLGRFLQTDPIGYEDQYNLYAYVGNDPVNGTDPTGEVGVVGAFIGAVVDGGVEAATQLVTEGEITDVGAIGRAALEGAVTGAVTGGVGNAVRALRAGSRLARGGRRGGSASRAQRAESTCCFVAGTLVDTEDGLRAIEEIKVGDLVWARDDETGETALKAVTDLIQRHERVIWEVELRGPDSEVALFETTNDHPWWIAGQGWKKTEELVAGMAVVTRDGRGMVLTRVDETSRTQATFNLTVADFETYFVGEQRVLVHNCPTGSYTNTHRSGRTYDGKGDERRAAQSGRRVAKENNDPLESTETRTAASNRESFKQESRSLDRNGGPRSDQNYNRIESPGKRMRREDGEID